MLMQEVDAKNFDRRNMPMAGVGPDAAQGVYGISVAAELVGTGVQHLRASEAPGLLAPERTEGGSGPGGGPHPRAAGAAPAATAPTTWTGCAASVTCSRRVSTSPASRWS